MRRRLLVAVGLLVSAAFLWLALRQADLGSIRASLSKADVTWAAPFVFVLLTFYWLKATRWQTLLSPALNSKARDLFPIVMIGYAGSAVLPMQMGELLRAYVAAKKYAVPYSLTLSSIFMERLFDLLTILALLACILLAGQATPDLLVQAGYIIAAATAAGLFVAVMLVRYTQGFMAAVQAVLSPLPAGIREKILHQLGAAARGLESIRTPALIARISLNSIVQWGLMGLCIAFSLTALNISVPPSGVVLVLVATIVGISLPTSPGYVGNIQLAFVVALKPFGVSAADAIAASVFYHVLAYVIVVVIGFYFLHRYGINVRVAESEAQQSISEVDSTRD